MYTCEMAHRTFHKKIAIVSVALVLAGTFSLAVSLPAVHASNVVSAPVPPPHGPVVPGHGHGHGPVVPGHD
jgi:hypothetical protein